MTKSRIIGVVSALVMLILSINFEIYAGAAFAVLLIIVGIAGKRFGKIGEVLAHIIWIGAAAYITYKAPGHMLNPIYPFYVTSAEALLNVACIITVCAVICICTGRVKISVTIGTLLLMILALANTFVFGFRGNELGPMDFLSVGTAANVAGQYGFEITQSMLEAWGLWLSVILAQLILPGQIRISKLISRVSAATLTAVLAVCVGSVTNERAIKTWETEGTRFNGYYLNFYLGLRDSAVKKPDKYSSKVVYDYSQEYDNIDLPDKKPNVIVIMDEAYTDFRILNPELRTNIPVTPFIDSLDNNTIRGKALSSVYGGNTANSEFEVLTGYSMSFLPSSTVPYQQYIHGDIYSLAWLMRSYGYKSVATHPYYADGWSREKVYPHMGFEKSTFIDAYPSQNLVRGYISDREAFEFSLDTINNTDEPLFLFQVTMQNHSGYDDEMYEGEIKLEGYSEEYPLAEQYLSLIHETDAALEYFITEVKKCGEDTIILFFGDHFPGVEKEFYNELYGDYIDELSEIMLEYTIPFFIWANFDIEESDIGLTSLNYLSTHLLRAAGFELSPYNQFLADIEKLIPGMNAVGHYSKAYECYVLYDGATPLEKEWLNKYWQIQYNGMFGKKNKNHKFFGQYILEDENEYTDFR